MVSLNTPRGGWSSSIQTALAALTVTPALGGFVCPRLGECDLARLATYLEQVTLWNARHNLTAARSAEELVDLFVADAAVLAGAFAETVSARAEKPQSKPAHDLGNPSADIIRWVDVGSGAGAPGLPLAIFSPQVRVTLVEPRAKRVAFLRSVIGLLDLKNATVQRGLSEELEPQSFEMAVSRATLPPEEWLLEGARLAQSAIWLLLAEVPPPSLPGWWPEVDLTYTLPLTGARRRTVRFRKGGARL